MFAILTLWIPHRWALSVFQSGIFLLAAVWIVGGVLGVLALRFHFLLLPLTGAVLWGLVQLLTHSTVYRFPTWNAVLFWETLLATTWLAFMTCKCSNIRWTFLRALMYFGWIVCLVSILQLFTSQGKVFWLFDSGYKDLVLGPFVYHNNFAAFVELLLPLTIFEAFYNKRQTLLFATMAGVMYAAVIASGSRAGSMLVTGESLAVAILFQSRISLPCRQLRLRIAQLIVLIAVCTAIVGSGFLWSRMHQADPFVYRREMLRSALDMARDRPWLGYGLGCFETVYPSHAIFDMGLTVNHVHNDWAEWLAEGGIPFLAMLLCVALWCIRPAVRSIWGIGVLAIFLHALVDYPMQRLGLAAWVFLMIGVLAGWEGDTVSCHSEDAAVRSPLSLDNA